MLAQLVKTFEMKDLRATKQILGIEIHRYEENDKRIQYEPCETDKCLFRFHCNISSRRCPGYKEEGGYVSCIVC
jgi:hypothetical protein